MIFLLFPSPVPGEGSLKEPEESLKAPQEKSNFLPPTTKPFDAIKILKNIDSMFGFDYGVISMCAS